jgi:mannose/fructose/N-acetylgalactosamine-specific phosphotransferase system component IIC
MLVVAFGLAILLGVLADNWLVLWLAVGWSIAEFRPRRVR